MVSVGARGGAAEGLGVDEKQGCLGDVTSGADSSRGDWLGGMRLRGRQWDVLASVGGPRLLDCRCTVHCTSQRTPCASIRKTNREMMDFYS